MKHPRAHAALVRAGRLPAAGREVLNLEERAFERLMLGVRLAEGVPVRGRARDLLPV